MSGAPGNNPAVPTIAISWFGEFMEISDARYPSVRIGAGGGLLTRRFSALLTVTSMPSALIQMRP